MRNSNGRSNLLILTCYSKIYLSISIPWACLLFIDSNIELLINAVLKSEDYERDGLDGKFACGGCTYS